MKVAIDTCSLLSLVRYYLPFDAKKHLHDLVLEKIKSREIIILDKIAEECRYTTGGLVVQKLDYIDKKGNHQKTVDLLPTPLFFRHLETDFLNASAKKLSPAEFETQKSNFLKSGDAKLILYALNQNSNGGVTIVTEETVSSNDNKPFKKIPAICKILGLQVVTLPQFIPTYLHIDVKRK